MGDGARAEEGIHDVGGVGSSGGGAGGRGEQGGASITAVTWCGQRAKMLRDGIAVGYEAVRGLSKARPREMEQERQERRSR